MVFSVVIIGELLAVVLTLSAEKFSASLLNNFAVISLFIQWNGLVCSAALCLLRPFLKKQSSQFIAFSSYFSILLIIIVLSELTFFILQYYYITRIISFTNHFHYVLYNLLIGGIVSALTLHYFYLQHQWRLKIHAENSAKLQLLQARIRPHFLFNSMNTIASLTRTQPALAERVTEDLAELFRLLLKENNELINWSYELELSQHYINIEKLRLSTRLSIDWQMDRIPNDAMVPALLLQPLLENAIFHGIEPELTGGEIHIIGDYHHKKITINIQNSNSQNMVHRQGNNMALKNISERLRAHYQGKASILCKKEKTRYHVMIVIPYLTKDEI
jgi:two-component system sensor histidine kinase AlgZ